MRDTGHNSGVCIAEKSPPPTGFDPGPEISAYCKQYTFLDGET